MCSFPTALAVLFAFILNPALTWLSRFLPLALAVGLVMTRRPGLRRIVARSPRVLPSSPSVAGSLTDYQTNLHQKIQDVR